jgi:hypothetical protein
MGVGDFDDDNVVVAAVVVRHGPGERVRACWRRNSPRALDWAVVAAAVRGDGACFLLFVVGGRGDDDDGRAILLLCAREAARERERAGRAARSRACRCCWGREALTRGSQLVCISRGKVKTPSRIAFAAAAAGVSLARGHVAWRGMARPQAGGVGSAERDARPVYGGRDAIPATAWRQRYRKSRAWMEPEICHAYLKDGMLIAVVGKRRRGGVLACT